MANRIPGEYAPDVSNTFLVWYEGFQTPAAVFVQGTITVGYTCFPTAAFLHVPRKFNIILKALSYLIFCFFSFGYVAMAFYVSLLFNEVMYTFFPETMEVTYYEDDKPKEDGKKGKKSSVKER